MAFGVKFKSVKTNQTFTVETLFDEIKDKTFSAGVPQLVKHGMVNVIAFPALDSQNQVQIINGGFKKDSQKWEVQKAEEAGAGNMAMNMALDQVTGGLFGFKQVIGTNAKKCEELVEMTAKELAEMGL